MAISSAAKPVRPPQPAQKTAADAFQAEMAPDREGGWHPKDGGEDLRVKVASLEATVKSQDALLRGLSTSKDAAKLLEVLKRIADRSEPGQKELKAITPQRNAEGFVERYEFEWQD